MIGETISHYQVTGEIGEGGMGIVYKAQDTKLERTVALKFLAAHLLSDEEAKKRFIREAKAAAALDHPNICTVHEIDEVRGKTFIAMAYLEGQTLAQKIAECPLQFDDALDIAAQIAQGLAEAHGKGIYHRDIKPSNAMLLEKGSSGRLVKIMDFGLAHLTGQSQLTEKGTSLGTPAYMSPGQAEGRPTDHRTDIWSLGVVLYEMSVGQMPFKGEYQQAIIYSILHEDYEPVTALRAGVPMELEWIVGKCLEKDPDRRYQSAAELVVDLENQREKLKSAKSRLSRSAAGTVAAGSPAGPSHPPAESAPVATAGQGQAESLSLPLAAQRVPRTQHAAPGETVKPARERLAWAVAALFAIATIALALAYFNQPAPRLETTRFVIHPPEGVRFGERAAEISPDGQHLAFVGISDDGEQHLWVRSLDSLEARPLPGTEGAALPFWSPDNRFIGFFAEGKLKKISAAGGPAQTLSEATQGSGGTWAQGSSGSDSVVVFAPTGSSALLRVSDAGGEPAPATVLDESAQESSHRFPYFLPDGRHFLYWGGRAGAGQVYTGSLDPDASRESASETKTPLLPDDTPVRYAPPPPGHPNGHLLFAREDTLMAQEFDANRLEPAGQPFPIAEGISASTLRVGLSDFSVSQTGVLAYRTGTGSAPHQLVWFGRDGKRLSSVGEPGGHAAVSLSLDNTKAAISLFDSSRDIWIYDLTRNVASRFTFDPAIDMTHTWSPDGRRLVFSSTRDGAFNLYVKPTSGAGEAELLLQTNNTKGPRDWSRDGRLILFVEQSPETGYDLWVLPLEGERKPVPYLQTEFNEVMGQFSPDGRWVAYVSNESGRGEIYVQPYPADGGKWQVSTDGGRQPRWRADGKELFYLTADDRVMAAEIEAGETFQPGVPHMLFRAPGVNPLLPDNFYHYDMSDDGQRFLIDVAAEESQQSPVTIVLNWQAELGR